MRDSDDSVAVCASNDILSIESNCKYQIINTILHGWIIREMVGVIPRYCGGHHVTPEHNLSKSGAGARSEKRAGAPFRDWGTGLIIQEKLSLWTRRKYLDRSPIEVWEDDRMRTELTALRHIPEVRLETSPDWLSASIHTDNAQVSPTSLGGERFLFIQ